MRAPNKFFEDQFPSTATAFSVGYPTAAEYQLALREGRGANLQFIAMMSGDLLTKVASHREATDCFSQYMFASRRMLLSLEMGGMATRKKQDNRQSDERPEWRGFLDLRLTEGQLEELDAWKPKPSEVWQSVDLACEAGFRFTLSYNKHTKLASCTMICDDAKSKAGGYALSNADSDGALSLKMAIFKHFVLLQQDWTPLLDIPPKARRG